MGSVPLKIATFNICGWKSAVNKGLLKWMGEEKIDVLAIQELRTENISKPLDSFLKEYIFYFNPSKFHGTAIITKERPIKIIKKIGYEKFDKEGRFLQAEYEDFLFINAYMPHGRRDKLYLPYKLEAYGILLNYLSNLIPKTNKPIILVGDFNIAHKEIDLARPKENENNIMFTKEEREQIDKIIELGFIDAYRKIHSKNGFTWWLRGFDARKRNIGWRIDYIFVLNKWEHLIKNAFVLNLEISDHCPVVVEIEK